MSKEKLIVGDCKTNDQSTNKIMENLYLTREEEILDSCYLEGEKDTKMCTLSFTELKDIKNNRKLVSLATDYAMSIGMEEVFVTTPAYDGQTIQELEKLGYESLEIPGEELENMRSFVKDKEIEREETVKWGL